MQGFKSFPDKTKITFEGGITAVVGPNGSGKSNISDAMRWVLGETSSKQLRGTGKMEDVIFGGTQGRNQMGFAAVSLYIDNADRGLDVDQDEVVVTRRYYRSGESEYAINGQNVRLKDIYEMFLDTGIGRDGYSIIGQGRIAEIVGAKSNDRREIFEEASGIAKYRYRKNEAERRLAAAEENLVRLRDILAELTERVGPLEKESEKAKEFLKLSEEKKGLEITLWVDSIRRAKETLREHQRKIETAKADYEDAERRLAEVEKEGEAFFFLSRKFDAENTNLRNEMTTITEEQGRLDASIAVHNTNIAHNEERIAELLEDISETGESAKTIEQEREEHVQGIAAAKQELVTVGVRIEEVAGTLAQLLEDSQKYDEKKQNLEHEVVNLTAQQTNWRMEKLGASSSIEEQEQRLTTVEGELETLEKRFAENEKEYKETTAFLEDLTQKLTAIENVKSGITYKLDGRVKQLDAAQQEAEKISRNIETMNQRIAVLTDLEQNMDGFSGSVKTVMRAGQNKRLRGLVGPVSSILQVKSGYEIAIETALGAALQNIVVENETAAKEAMQFLKTENAGRATFLPLDTIKGRSLDNNTQLDSAIPATEAVQYDGKYSNIVSSLLGRILLVDTINEASAIARKNGFRYRIVTKDGQVVNAGGSFTGGSVGRSAGLFSRKIEIDELKKKVQEQENAHTAAMQNVQKWKDETNKLRAELDGAAGESTTYGGDKIRAEVEVARLENAVTQSETGIKTLQAEKEKLQTNISSNRAKITKAEEEIEVLQKRINALDEELEADDGSDVSDFSNARTALMEEQQNLALKKFGLEKDITIHENAIEQLLHRSSSEETSRAQIEQSIALLKQQIENEQNAIATVQTKKEECATKMQEVDNRLQEVLKEKMEAEEANSEQTGKLKSIGDEKENLTKEMTRLEERKASLEQEYDNTIAKLWEEYEVTLSEAATMTVAFNNVTELRRMVNEVRSAIKALGAVNVNAIEEFAQVSERYIFLKEQVADVETSKAELENLISGLKTEMEVIFRNSFAEINKNFGEVFVELFGGGSARLSLTDDQNILECGIDIEVAPPGKIIKSLNALSGGEQALVAISIYFAILAVNPAPFCVLDEIEAALDDVNVVRYANYLRRICDDTQFIVITHRRGTMEEADVLYGVTMQEDGVSKILRLNANEVDAQLVS